MLQFQPLSLAYEKKYTEHYNQCLDKTSDMSFINAWAWQDKYHFEVAFEDELCWIRSHDGEKIIYNYPLGNWERDDWQELLEKHFPQGFDFIKVPVSLAIILKDIYQSKLELNEDRDNWEYIYSINELISLAGYRFRNKRKLANQFKQFYNYIYKHISETEVGEIIKFQEKWLNQHEIKEIVSNNLESENKAILRVLNHWSQLPKNIFGGVLSVGEDVVAYTIGEKVDDSSIIIHFEKAMFEYKGAYQAINRICMENIGNYKFVNREQDLGLEGLRKSKLEYNPIRYIKKYNLVLR